MLPVQPTKSYPGLIGSLNVTSSSIVYSLGFDAISPPSKLYVIGYFISPAETSSSISPAGIKKVLLICEPCNNHIGFSYPSLGVAETVTLSSNLYVPSPITLSIPVPILMVTLYEFLV